MADLHVQPKKTNNNTWIWVILALIIVAAVVYYFGFYKKNIPVTDQTFIPVPAAMQYQPALDQQA